MMQGKLGIRLCRLGSLLAGYLPFICLVIATLGIGSQVSAQFGPALVKVAPVVEREIATGQSFVATVMPSKKTIVGSAVEGRVLRFLVNEGDLVKTGQVLAELRTGTIEIELAEAKAELQLRQEELTELKNGSRPDEILQAQALMDAAKSRAEYVASKLRRFSSLLDRKAVSREEFDETSSAAAAAEHAFREAEAAYRLTKEGPRKEKIAQMEARVRVQEEAVNRIVDRIEKFKVQAYFDGYVTKELTEVGYWIKSGEPVVEMMALDEIEMRAMVLEDYIAHVHKGAEVRVQLGALPDRTFIGHVQSIIPQADVKSRGFPVLVRVKNPFENGEHVIKSGMFGKMTLPIGAAHSGLMVPKDALVLTGQGALLYVLTPKAVDPMAATPGAPAAAAKTASPATKSAPAATGGATPAAASPAGPEWVVRPVPVELGVAEKGWIEITGGVKPGDKVVVLGNERLRPGQDVKVVAEIAPETASTNRTAPAASPATAPATLPKPAEKTAVAAGSKKSS